MEVVGQDTKSENTNRKAARTLGYEPDEGVTLVFIVEDLGPLVCPADHMVSEPGHNRTSAAWHDANRPRLRDRMQEK